jgi:hypothetical protein
MSVHGKNRNQTASQAPRSGMSCGNRRRHFKFFFPAHRCPGYVELLIATVELLSILADGE